MGSHPISKYVSQTYHPNEEFSMYFVSMADWTLQVPWNIPALAFTCCIRRNIYIYTHSIYIKIFMYAYSNRFEYWTWLNYLYLATFHSFSISLVKAEVESICFSAFQGALRRRYNKASFPGSPGGFDAPWLPGASNYSYLIRTMINGNFRNLNWRCLPYIRPI